MDGNLGIASNTQATPLALKNKLLLFVLHKFLKTEYALHMSAHLAASQGTFSGLINAAFMASFLVVACGCTPSAEPQNGLPPERNDTELRISRFKPGTRFEWTTTGTGPGNVTGTIPFKGKSAMSVTADYSAGVNDTGETYISITFESSVEEDFNSGLTAQTTFRRVDSITYEANGGFRKTQTSFLVGRLSGVHMVVEFSKPPVSIEPGLTVEERTVYNSGLVETTETTYGNIVRHTSSLGTFKCIEFSSTSTLKGIGTESSSGLFSPELGVNVVYSSEGSNGFRETSQLSSIVRPD